MIEASLVIAAYLIGSISTAIIVCRLMNLPDPRSQGSNNPGATNVLRIGGKRAAAITLIGDGIKGWIPVFVAQLMDMPPLILALTALAAFLGHLYPIFFGFKGGKGVATALGVQFGWSWMIGLSVALTWLFVAKVLKISSLAALVCMSIAPAIVWYFSNGNAALVSAQVLITLLLIWRHRSNIKNLLAGEELKVTESDEEN